MEKNKFSGVTGSICTQKIGSNVFLYKKETGTSPKMPSSLPWSDTGYISSEDSKKLKS